MRFIVYGAGAIGATIGGRLHQSGHDVVLIARGAQLHALRDGGLLLQTHDSHDGLTRLDVPVVQHPAELQLSTQDIVILAMKTQDTAAALNALAAVAPAELAIACAQNGVENERLALRSFERVHGISVMCPALHLKPGVVQAFGTPLTGLLDVGRYPAGSDETTRRLVEAFRSSTFGAEVCPNIRSFKYGKLLFNLGNAIEAVCGPAARNGPIAELVRQEAWACLRAAGLEVDAQAASARAERLVTRPLGAEARPGGSSWQSLARSAGTIETDYLNGEIVLLGRMTGVPAPANTLLQRLANDMARARRPPGGTTSEEFLDRLARRAQVD